ncbi:LysE family translocator [Nocardiopsis sp. EMB25]|uniref:LysE family translocator n=1 Tax=Nocardiopsis sp. EMB25 TaxID=2835867 RepID=UPI002284F463|nr:LysE family translocator [Nocardiopsis sp. EMB25]MCY9783779.1 LysE family translocator [Nocardiopsis sp. EMB25]
MSVEFLLTALVVVAVPGTGVLYTVGVGLSRGTRASVLAAFGCTLGIVPHALAAVTGVAALLHASATAFQVLKYAGVAYLLFMAWSTWRDRGALAVKGDASSRSGVRVVVSGVLLNLLNPKLTIFFLAFLPQFVGAGAGDPLVRMLVLSGVFMALTFAVFVVYGRFSALVRDRVVGDERVLAWLRRGFAGAFALLGLRLAVAQP